MVEDDPAVATMLMTNLADYQYNVCSARSAKEAQQLIPELHERGVTIAVIDYHLQAQETGAVVVKLIREANAAMAPVRPITIIGCSGSMQDKFAALCDCFILKTVGSAEKICRKCDEIVFEQIIEDEVKIQQAKAARA